MQKFGSKSWLRLSLTGLVCSSLLLMPPVQARTVLRTGLDDLADLRLMTPRVFDPAQQKIEIALDLEDPHHQTEALRMAKLYIDFKSARGSSAQEKFRDTCGKPQELTNPFCKFEQEKAAKNSTRADRPARANRKDVISDLKQADISDLNDYSHSDILRALSTFEHFAPLERLAEKIIGSSSCPASALSAALGAKAEEFFPAQKYVDYARGLYNKAATCDETAESIKARFRLSLIEIWHNNCAQADSHLSALEKTPEASPYLSRVRYWRFHCGTVTGNMSVRTEAKEALFRHHLLSFQNIAANGSEERFQTRLHAQEPLMISYRSLVRPDLNQMIRGVEALLRLGANTLAADWVDQNMAFVGAFEPEVRLYFAYLMDQTGQSLAKFKVLTALFEDAPRMLNENTLRLFFPMGFYELLKENSQEIDPLLLLSLIRQESAFNQNARSVVGARGLMQVMPATARGIASVSSRKLYDPKVNIKVGTKYFAHRLDQYRGDVELTLAAYNAGFSRVDKWIKRYPVSNKLLFIDLIPFKETRDYVSTILRNYFLYTKLYGSEALRMAIETGPKLNAVGPKALAIMSGNAGARAEKVADNK